MNDLENLEDTKKAEMQENVKKLVDARSRLLEQKCKANGGCDFGEWSKSKESKFCYSRTCKSCGSIKVIQSQEEIKEIEEAIKTQDKANDVLNYLEESAKNPEDILFSIIKLYENDLLFYCEIERFIEIASKKNILHVDYLGEYSLVREMIDQIKIVCTKNGRGVSDEDWDKMDDLVKEGKELLNSSDLEEKAHLRR